MNDLAPTLAVVDYAPISASKIKEQITAIQIAMRDCMEEGVHYGTIPGCGDKPALMKSGAEKLSMMFRFRPKFTVTKTELANGHREYEVLCTLLDARGDFVGEGVGSCSTMETKYRYRKAERVCPECGKASIIKGRAEYGGGWVCFKKHKTTPGCGAKFQDEDPAILSQPEGRVENVDIADTYNTVLKMSKKRAHVDAIITATAASDIFTQDIDERIEQEMVTVEATPSKVEQPPPPPKPEESHAERILAAFKRFKVSKEMLQFKFGCPLEELDELQVERLKEIYADIAGGVALSEHFDMLPGEKD